MKDLKAIAIMNGLSQVLVGTGNCIFLSVPCIAITCRSGIFYRICVVDSQMERGDAITAVRSGSSIYVIARGGVGLTIPGICIAGCSGELSILSTVDGQVEDLKTITAMDGLSLVRIST